MAATRLDSLKASGVFILARYPFCNALILLMVLSERADQDKNIPPIPVNLIYSYIAIMFALGVGMSYDLKRKECALAFVGQLAYFSYTIYTNAKLGYNPWLQNRLICRSIGLMGIFTIFAFLTSAKKNKQLQKIGEGLLAIYTMAYMYILVNSPEDRGLFSDRLPISDVLLYFLITVMATCAMIYISGGMFVTDACQAVMCIDFALVLLLYIDMTYWHKNRGIPFWIQSKIVIDDITISIGLFVMAFAKLYWHRRIPKGEKYN